MDTPRNFRSAFNGFNREDVVRYIEYMNAKHTAQVNELNTQVEFLRGKLIAGQAEPAQDPKLLEQLNNALQQISALESRCAQLEQERDAAAGAVDTAAAENLEARCAQLERERDAALAAAAQAEAARESAVQSQSAKELEAYRRAERTERVARERAEQVYTKVNGVLSDATVKVDEAAAQIGEMSEQVLARLTQLQNAVSGSKQALEDAAATMYAIRPSGEDE